MCKLASVLFLAIGSVICVAGCAASKPATQPPAQSPEAAPSAVPPAPKASIANPASVNCIKQGGTLQIRKVPGGGEYGVCIFADAKECEEWALMRAECPAGGVVVSGYTTDAQRFCAITGAKAKDQDTCVTKDGKSCPLADYFALKCK